MLIIWHTRHFSVMNLQIACKSARAPEDIPATSAQENMRKYQKVTKRLQKCMFKRCVVASRAGQGMAGAPAKSVNFSGSLRSKNLKSKTYIYIYIFGRRFISHIAHIYIYMYVIYIYTYCFAVFAGELMVTPMSLQLGSKLAHLIVLLLQRLPDSIQP